MSGECPPGGWTPQTLFLYVDRRFEDSQRSVDLAAEALAVRLESMNEFREQIRSERGSYASVDRVTALERWQARIAGALILVTVLIPALSALIVYLVTRK